MSGSSLEEAYDVTPLSSVRHAVHEGVLDIRRVLGRRLEVRTNEGLDRWPQEEGNQASNDEGRPVVFLDANRTGCPDQSWA